MQIKITKWVYGIAAVILAALVLLIGSFIYVTRYKTTASWIFALGIAVLILTK